jgi:hypothetical protein
MSGVYKNLYTSLKGKESVFNFLSDEDLTNLSTFFESKNEIFPLFLKARMYRQARPYGKKMTLLII